MSANLRTPVGAHLCRTIRATDPPDTDGRFFRGLAFGLLLAGPLWVLLWLALPVAWSGLRGVWGVLRLVGL